VLLHVRSRQYTAYDRLMGVVRTFCENRGDGTGKAGRAGKGGADFAAAHACNYKDCIFASFVETLVFSLPLTC